MLTPAAAKALSPEERIMRVAPLVSKRVEEILDKSILVALARTKNKAEAVIHNCNIPDEQNLDVHLLMHGYTDITIKTSYCEGGPSSTYVEFIIP